MVHLFDDDGEVLQCNNDNACIAAVNALKYYPAKPSHASKLC